MNASPARGPDRAPGAPECRCSCGSLLARIADRGVELKCRRCKRTILVPWSAREGFVAPIDLALDPGVVSGAA